MQNPHTTAASGDRLLAIPLDGFALLSLSDLVNRMPPMSS